MTPAQKLRNVLNVFAPDRTGARYAYTVHVGSHDGPLYWGYSGLEFDTVKEAQEHAAKTWARDVEQKRTTRAKSELYLVVSPVSVHYVSTPGTW